MYRAPKSGSGGSGFLMLLILLWGAFYLAGCADVATGPELDGSDPIENPWVDLDKIELTVDPDLVDAAIADVAYELGASPSATAEAELGKAATLFEEAQTAYTSGNLAQVQELGEQARLALGRTVVLERGPSGVEDRIARVENLRARLQAGDTQDYDRPAELADRLSDLVDRAQDAKASGNDALAGAMMVEADQRSDRSRTRRHDRGDATENGARLAVAMAKNAVELAVRLLGDTEPSERQAHLLATAERLTAGAAEALEGGQYRRAIMLGHKAVSTSLLAVIAPDVDENEVRMIKELAEEMLEAARATLEAEPNDALQELLERAVHAYELGVRKIEEGNFRGVALLWNAAVVGAVIVG